MGASVAFSKFDPHRPEEGEREGHNDSADRRARILRYAWWVTVAYTALGFVFLAVFWRFGFPF